jgi:hypothetical protein
LNINNTTAPNVAMLAAERARKLRRERGARVEEEGAAGRLRRSRPRTTRGASPYTIGISQCTNDKIYLTTGVTTAVGVGIDEQNTIVVAKPGKTVDDVVSGESKGVTVSSAKLGGSGSVAGNENGGTVSVGPSLGAGVPAGITDSTTTQIGTFTPPPVDKRKQDNILMSKPRRVLVNKLGVPQQ